MCRSMPAITGRVCNSICRLRPCGIFWIHGEDLVLGTYGRSLWILDDITPLRQLEIGTTSADLTLYEPAPAIRARWDVNGDTPLPVEVPAAPNPPEGAIIDYSLPVVPSGEMTLDHYRRARQVGAHVHVHGTDRIQTVAAMCRTTGSPRLRC